MTQHTNFTDSTPREIDIKVGHAMSTLYRVFAGELDRVAGIASQYASYWDAEPGAHRNSRFVVVSLYINREYRRFHIDTTKYECSKPDYSHFAVDGYIVDSNGPSNQIDPNAIAILRERSVSAEDVAREMAAEDDRCAEIIARIDEAREIIAAGDAEYKARGGWNRYYLVTSSSGHIHSSMGCSTCHKGKHDTTFALVADLSDADTSEAVDIFGAALCSVCYPAAPVEFTNEVKITKAAAEAFEADGIDGFRAYTAKIAARKAKREGK
jgi:hypothetical protein